MKTPTLYLLALVVALAHGNSESRTDGGGADETLTPGAKGSSVVETVTDRIEASCIFDDDKLFLRRLAYVESSDGHHPDTYREGYDGGIWQVDQAMYDQTKGANLQTFIQEIQTVFGIDWASSRWEDLLMPLCSGLAARLYIQHSSGGVNISRDIPGQADFWKQHYRPGGNNDDFTAACEQLEEGCERSKGPDMVFVLDGSGSIGVSRFLDILQFVENVVKGYDIGPDKTRIAVIQYATSVRHEFDLNAYNNKDDVIDAVKAIQYMNGYTATHLAIDAMIDHAFQEANGARPKSAGHARVGVVLTDGASNSQTLTIAAAQRAHEAGITMLAVGVGSSLSHDELEAIASIPTCLHLFYLGFDEIDSLYHAIEKRACETGINMDPSDPDDIIISPPWEDVNCKLTIPKNGVTVKVVTYTGVIYFYTASDTYPTPSYYERKVRSVPGNNGVMYLDGNGVDDRYEFCHIQGSNETESNVSIGVKPGDRDWCNSNPCENDGDCADQGDDYVCICPPGYTGAHCEEAEAECDPNPCGEHGHFHCTCDDGWTGEHCDQEIGSEGGYNCGDNNPCTQENIDNGHFYHAHEDPNKFVQCSEWGQCFVMDCPPGLVWDPEAYTCNWPPAETSGYNCDDNNPCTPEHIGNHRFYHPHEDPNKFVQCSEWGQCFVMDCPPGLVWDPQAYTCNWPPAK